MSKSHNLLLDGAIAASIVALAKIEARTTDEESRECASDALSMIGEFAPILAEGVALARGRFARGMEPKETMPLPTCCKCERVGDSPHPLGWMSSLSGTIPGPGDFQELVVEYTCSECLPPATGSV